MTHIGTTIITTRIKMTKFSKKYTICIINGYVYVEKNIIVFKSIYDM